MMKIALQCQDLILERALQLFLKEYLSQKKDCDFIIVDEKIAFNKPQFIISKYPSQLQLPFSKEELLSALNEFDKALKELAEQIANEKIKALEAKIKTLADEFKLSYQKDIEEAVGALEQRLIKSINEER